MEGYAGLGAGVDDLVELGFECSASDQEAIDVGLGRQVTTAPRRDRAWNQ